MIRTATERDIPELVVLLETLGYPRDEEFVRDKLEVYATSDSAHVLVDAREDAAVGFLVLDVQLLFHQEGNIGCIMAMAVLDEWRGRGVGTALVREAERIARQAGCVKISVASGIHRTETHRFYRSLGFEEITKRFVKQLGLPN